MDIRQLLKHVNKTTCRYKIAIKIKGQRGGRNLATILYITAGGYDSVNTSSNIQIDPDNISLLHFFSCCRHPIFLSVTIFRSLTLKTCFKPHILLTKIKFCLFIIPICWEATLIITYQKTMATP
jgi:hypothetical protein